MSDKDMSVDVTVTVSGSYDLSSNPPPTITAQYSAQSDPQTNGVVGSNGLIDLTKMTPPQGYTTETKISFKLAGDVTDTSDKNKKCNPKFPSSGDKSISVSLQEGNGRDGVPEGWDKNRNSDTKITITDPDADGATYDYTLFVELNGHTCPVDPSIINRRSD